ncbi:MAG: FecR domain-containing protein [Magnetococcales bacterium]|nr:FecR domain-containing protein [Magnetococcales bacterium]
MLTPNSAHGLLQASTHVASLTGEVSGIDGWIQLADAALFLDGEFSRAGDALIITSPTGEQVVVADYFITDPPPVLTAPNGAFLLPETVALLLPGGVSGLLVAGPVPEHTVATGTTGTTKAGGGTIGQVKGLTGAATARSQGGESHDLKVGDNISEGDEVKTADGGQVQLLFLDGTQFQVGPGARIVLNKFVYNPEAAKGEFGATVMKGAFAYASGDIAHQHPGRHSTIKTPTAQIGIRGSALQGEVTDDGQTTVVHTSGVLDIADAHGQGTVTLLQPGMATVVTLDGSPQPAFHAPQSILDRFKTILPPVLHDHKPDTSHDKAGETSHHDLHDDYKDTSHDAKSIKTTLGIQDDVKLEVEEHEKGKDDPFKDLFSHQAPVNIINHAHGTFLDSPVAGLHYQTATTSGVTDQNGGFWFAPGETVTFSIGNMTIGTISAANIRAGTGGLPIVTLDKLADAATATATANVQADKHLNVVTNIARLLQTLDSDGNPDNGITITAAASQAASGTAAQKMDFAESTTQFGYDAAAFVIQATHDNATPKTALISASSALANYNQTLTTLAATSHISVETASFLYASQGQTLVLSLPLLTPGLTYTAAVTGRGGLPGWLEFNGTTLDSKGLTLTNDEVGAMSIRFTATTGTGAAASVNYVLLVQNINDSPVLNSPIGPQAVRTDAANGLHPAYPVACQFGELMLACRHGPTWLSDNAS